MAYPRVGRVWADRIWWRFRARPAARRRILHSAVLLPLVAAAACSQGGSFVPPRATPPFTAAPSPPAVTPAPEAPSPPQAGSSPEAPPSADADPASRTNALVTRVIDGDTIEVRSRGRILDVRLIGIDTPESVAPGEPVQCFALAASRFTTRELESERVWLEFDVERTDRYGRTLAYVWLGRELFNETLVREGYAFVTTYPPNVRYVERFLEAQREARAHDRGVWGRCVDEDAQRACDPSYPDVCIPPPPPDLDCADVDERRFAVRPPDPHGFDGDGDGIGCET